MSLKSAMLSFLDSTTNNSKTSASVSQRFPNKAVRRSAFITFECLKILVKHEAQVFEIASQSGPNCKQKKKKTTKESKNCRSMAVLPSFIELAHSS